MSFTIELDFQHLEHKWTLTYSIVYLEDDEDAPDSIKEIVRMWLQNDEVNPNPKRWWEGTGCLMKVEVQQQGKSKKAYQWYVIKYLREDKWERTLGIPDPNIQGLGSEDKIILNAKIAEHFELIIKPALSATYAAALTADEKRTGVEHADGSGSHILFEKRALLW